MSKISQRSDKRIRDLADGTTTDNVTLSKLANALEYCEIMQAERPFVASKDEALAVTACLYILHIYLKASLDRPSLHSPALPHLLRAADATLYWLDVGIRLYTDNKPVYFPSHVADYITALHNLFNFDPSTLRPLLIAEPLFFDLILSLWHPREQDFAWTFLDNPKTPNDAPCPVVCLFRAVVQDQSTRAAFLDHVSIHHPRRGSLLLAQGTIRRAERSLSNRYSAVLSYKKLYYVYFLVSIMWCLCEDNPPMRRRFTHTCLAPETFSRVLERHIRKALQVEIDPCNIVPGAGTNVTLIDWIFRQDDARVVRNFTEMIRGRLLHTVSLVFAAAIPAHIKEETAVLAPILAPFTAYPLVVRELTSVWGDVARTGRPEKYDTVPQSWRDFWSVAAYNVRVYEGMRRMHVCDNQRCPGEHNVPDQEYKHCGGCSLVAYCSPMCQRADWVAYHRHECTKARCERSDLMESELRYHHGARAFHLALIESRLNDIPYYRGTGGDVKYGEPPPPIEPPKTIPLLSFLGLNFKCASQELRYAAQCEIRADGDKVQYPGEWAAVTADGNGLLRVPPKRWLDFLADYMEEVAEEELALKHSRANEVGEVNPNHPPGDLDDTLELLPANRGGIGESGFQYLPGKCVRLVMAHFAVSHGFIVTHLVKLRRASENSNWRAVGGVWRYGAR